MKKQILGILTLAVALSASALQAEEGAYIGVNGGLNIKEENKVKGVNVNNESVTLNLKKGYKAGGSIGYKFSNGFRTEAEVAYRNNDFKKLHFSTDEGDSVSIKTSINSISYMGNLLYDLDLGCGLTPYVGGGVGYSEVKARAATKQLVSVGASAHKGLAYQGIAGIYYPICAKTVIGAEYNYHVAHDTSIRDHSAAVTLKRFF